jgi:hypothetical protein
MPLKTIIPAAIRKDKKKEHYLQYPRISKKKSSHKLTYG